MLFSQNLPRKGYFPVKLSQNKPRKGYFPINLFGVNIFLVSICSLKKLISHHPGFSTPLIKTNNTTPKKNKTKTTNCVQVYSDITW